MRDQNIKDFISGITMIQGNTNPDDPITPYSKEKPKLTQEKDKYSSMSGFGIAAAFEEQTDKKDHCIIHYNRGWKLVRHLPPTFLGWDEMV